MKRLGLVLGGALLLASCQHAAAQRLLAEACPPPGYDSASLSTLRANHFAIPDDARRNAFALDIAACLSSPDPALRDGVGFEAMQHLLRERQLNVETMRTLEGRLRAHLFVEDSRGFTRPFAALVLSELARADRIDAYLSGAERAALLDAAVAYLQSVRDYRGYDEREGWRHGVAHGADLLMQLALNPALGRTDIERIMSAVESQIAPIGHFYVYGESERLARPILMIARRDVFTESEWTAWLARIAAPAPLNDWSEAFSSQRGLAQRHNTAAFFQTLYANARVTAEPAYAPLLPGLETGLRTLP